MTMGFCICGMRIFRFWLFFVDIPKEEVVVSFTIVVVIWFLDDNDGPRRSSSDASVHGAIHRQETVRRGVSGTAVGTGQGQRLRLGDRWQRRSRGSVERQLAGISSQLPNVRELEHGVGFLHVGITVVTACTVANNSNNSWPSFLRLFVFPVKTPEFLKIKSRGCDKTCANPCLTMNRRTDHEKSPHFS